MDRRQPRTAPGAPKLEITGWDRGGCGGMTRRIATGRLPYDPLRCPHVVARPMLVVPLGNTLGPLTI